MKKDLLFVLAIALAAGASSCAVGRKMSFENKEADPGYSTTKSATIIFQDKRVEVLSGKEKPTFCGHSNSTGQISYNIQTQSGRPLADEFAESVTTSYNKAGGAGTAMLVNMNTSRDSIMQAFKNGNKDRLLFFSMHKWESRATPLFSSIRYEMIYELELNVYNSNGELLASGSTSNIVVKEQGAATSMKKMQEMADDTFKEQIRVLFSSDAVKKSLM
jgi:hypothetical protein